MNYGKSALFLVSLVMGLICIASTQLVAADSSEEVGEVGASLSLNLTCADNDSGSLPHSDNCAQFFVCLGGIASLHDCDAGLLYDLVLGGCNHAEDVLCGDRTRPDDGTGSGSGSGSSSESGSESSEEEADSPSTTTTTTTTTTPSPPTNSSTTASPKFECPSDFGYFPHSSSNKFYQCSNGIAYVMTCPANLVWNADPNILTCDYPK